MGFSRQEYWSGLPFPSLGDLSDPGMELSSPVSPAWQVDSLPAEPSGHGPAINAPCSQLLFGLTVRQAHGLRLTVCHLRIQGQGLGSSIEKAALCKPSDS